jgi:hypothetical protein
MKRNLLVKLLFLFTILFTTSLVANPSSKARATTLGNISFSIPPQNNTGFLPLPKGYSATSVSMSSTSPETAKQDFYKKSGGKNSYVVYRNEKGIEVTEQEVRDKYKEEMKNNPLPPVMPNAK